MKYFIAVLPLATCLLISCSHSKKITRKTETHEKEKTIVLDTLTVSAHNSVYQKTAPRLWNISHTRVALGFNYKEKTANGREWLKLSPYCYPADTLVLDAKGMVIDTVMMEEGKDFRKLSYTYEHDKLKIKFGKACLPADTLHLYITYKAMPYATATGGSDAITEDRGLYFINTDEKVPGKPVQIWTQGETESNSHWMPTIDKPNTRFTFEVELNVPDNFVTLSNGHLVKSLKEGSNLRKDIWRIDTPIQAYAAMFAIGKFSILKDSWHGKEVNYYVEPKYAPYARQMFKHTTDMLGYFSEITGVPYPWNKYDQIVVRDYVSGAMENTTASLFGEFMNENAREIADRDYEDIVSHELFHMWFGDYVTCESWSNITVNESFANYGEQLWREHEYGKASVDRLAYNDLNAYIQASQTADPALVRFYYNDKEDVFDRISYEKGGAVLNYMRSLMGPDVFNKAMKIYLTKNALHAAEADNWRLAAEEATGQDWNPFFNQWYYRGGHPILKINYKYNDSAQQVTVNVNQVQSDSTYTYQLPLKAAIILGNAKEVVDWDITKKKQSFTYSYVNGARPTIIPDCNHVLPGQVKDDKPLANWMVQLAQSGDYISKYKALSGAWGKMPDSTALNIITAALTDTIAPIRAYAITILRYQKSEKIHDKLNGTIQNMAMNDGNNEVRANAYQTLGYWKISSAKSDMMNAVWDSSYNVAGAALGGIIRLDSIAAYSLAKKILPTQPEESLYGETWMAIGKRGNDNDIDLFRKEAPYVYGNKQFSFATGLYYYILNVQNIITYEQGLAILTQLIAKENIKGYRMGLSSLMFEMAKKYKGDDKKEAAQRLFILKSYLQKVIDAEKDPSNTSDYNNLMKENFGTEK